MENKKQRRKIIKKNLVVRSYESKFSNKFELIFFCKPETSVTLIKHRNKVP